MNASIRRPTAGRQAFTLIEMVVVTAIILIMAGLMLPNMVAMTQSRELRTELAALERMPTDARNEAVKSQSVVDLRIDGDYMVMEHTDPQTQDVTEVKRIPIGSQLQPQSAQLEVVGVPTALMTTDTGNTDVASWKWSAYPDGTSDSGGLSFEVGPKRQVQSLYIAPGGDVKWMAGSLPQTTDESWTAGDIEQRTGTNTSVGAATKAPAKQ